MALLSDSWQRGRAKEASGGLHLLVLASLFVADEGTADLGAAYSHSSSFILRDPPIPAEFSDLFPPSSPTRPHRSMLREDESYPPPDRPGSGVPPAEEEDDDDNEIRPPYI
ncbi:hypothetical protein MY11210_002252 [Beauveria gryllotalpidicola]